MAISGNGDGSCMDPFDIDMRDVPLGMVASHATGEFNHDAPEFVGLCMASFGSCTS